MLLFLQQKFMLEYKTMKRITFIFCIVLLALFTGYAQTLATRNALWMTWMQDEQGNVAGLGNKQWGIFQRFAAEDLTPYIGQYLTKIRYMPADHPDQYTVFTQNPRVRVYVGGWLIPGTGNFYEGVLVADIEVTDYSFWYYNYIELPTPIVIDGTQQITFGVVYSTSQGFPATTTAASGTPSYINWKSNLIWDGDFDWWWTSANAFPAPNNKFCWDLAAYTRDPLPLSRCAITVDMADAFGDGWTNGMLSFVDENGTEWDRITLNGASNTLQVELPKDVEIYCHWTPGDYPNEVSFTIKNAAGTVLYTCNTGDFSVQPAGEFFSFTNICEGSDCMGVIVDTDDPNWHANDNTLPLIIGYSASYTQQIIPPYFIGSYGEPVELTSVAFEYSGETVTCDNITFYMGHTTKNEFSSNTDWIPVNQLQEVFSGTITFNSSQPWFTVPFDTPFTYEGGNLVLAVLFNQGGYASFEYFPFTQFALLDGTYASLWGNTTYGTLDISGPVPVGGNFYAMRSWWLNSMKFLACPQGGIGTYPGPLYEPFENGFPEGWETDKFGYSSMNGVDNLGMALAGLGNYMGDYQAYLQTPLTDMGNNPKLSFALKITDHPYAQQSNPMALSYNVSISNDFGTTWSTVLNVPVGAHVPADVFQGFRTIVIDPNIMSVYANQVCMVKFSFAVQNNYEIYVCLDDVLLGTFDEYTDLTALRFTGSNTPSVGTPASLVLQVLNSSLTKTMNASDYTVKLMQVTESGNVELLSLSGKTVHPLEIVEVPIPWVSQTEGQITVYGEVVLTSGTDINPDDNQTINYPVEVYPEGESVVAIGLGSTCNYNTPLNFYSNNSWSQSVYFDYEIGYTPKVITKMQYFNNFHSNISEPKPIKIYLANTEQPYISPTWYDMSEFILVFDGTVSFPQGENGITIELDVPFLYTGHNLIVMAYRVWENEVYDENDHFANTPQSFGNRTRYQSSDTDWNSQLPEGGDISATFFPNVRFYMVEPTYTITATAGDNGTIEPIGNTTVNYGASQTYTITPNAGYEILQVLVDDVNNPQAVYDKTYCFMDVKANHTIHAEFKLKIGIPDTEEATINIFSHQNKVTILNEKLVDIQQIEIMDMYGRVVWSGGDGARTVSTEITLNVAVGIYGVRITTGGGQIFMAKVVIQ
jgi:hypothetical protein